jgi:hypothetical protein
VVGDSAITNSVTGTASWPRQQLEPLYAWNNTWTPVPNNPGSLYGISAPTVIKLGTDFYDGIAKPGYTPYVYPHPLRSGSSVVVPPVVTPTPDTTLPTVSITTPSNNSSVSGSVSISATASDNIGVIGVQWKLDGANLGSELTTAPYSGTWNTIGVSNGTHTLTATARDLAGNTKVSSTITLAISNTTPVTTTPSTGGSTGGGSTSGGTTSGGGGTSTTGTFTPTVTQKPAITTATTCKATNDLGRIIELFISLGIIKPDKVSSARTYLCSLSQPTTNNSQLTTGQRFTLALDLGSRNTEVTRLQTYLISQKLLSTLATGYFGPATAKAVGLFQQKYNLSTPGSSSYGFVGPKTRAKLNELVR